MQVNVTSLFFWLRTMGSANLQAAGMYVCKYVSMYVCIRLYSDVLIKKDEERCAVGIS